MSIEAIKEEGKKCREDGEMKKKAEEIGMGDTDALIAYGKEKGFDFSKDDMTALGKETQAEGELSEGDLEQVAGGIVTSTAAAVVGACAGVGSAVAGGVGAAAGVTKATSASGW